MNSKFSKLIILTIFLIIIQQNAQATDLLEVYQQAQASDPIYQQAIAQRLSIREGVPISIAALLPNISVQATPAVGRTGLSGTQYSTITNGSAATLTPRNNTQRTYLLSLTVTQTVFNFAQFASVAGAQATAKGADATLNAAVQNLITRVASAYFAVLQDEETLSYNKASKLAYAEQLDQIKQQYHVGLKTITDVYTAQASYDSAVASYIGAETTLRNDKENLRAITGVYYDHLSGLSDNFPLVTPNPQNVERWIETAQNQNWTLKAAQYAVDTARQAIKQQYAGHMPTVSVEGIASRNYIQNINGYTNLETRNGPGTISNRAVTVNMTLPFFEGGGVVAQTNQAIYNYQYTQQQLEQTLRATVNATSQSYLGVISGISKVKADRQSIRSNASSLEGMEASYNVGTQTLVDVLNQQQKLFQAQTQYATDRYAFVNSLLALKQAAGTLSFDDLRAINTWLTDKIQIRVPKNRKMKDR